MQDQANIAQRDQRDGSIDMFELGNRLAAARVAMDLGVDEVAQRLHLPTATITDLESGQIARIGTPVYLKGFLRSYLRLMALPEVWAEQALATSGAGTAPAVRPAAGAVARRVSWLDRYKWATSYVVGTALALTAVHWLVSNTPQLGLPDSTQAPSFSGDQAPPASVSQPISATPPNIAPVGPMTTPLLADETQSAEANNNNRELPPMLASLSPFRVSSPSGDDDSAPLQLEFDQDSWVDVRDQADAKLAYSVIRAGDQRSFDSGESFTVNIGNVGGVRVVIAGDALDLAPFTKGNVAKFSLTRVDGRWVARARSAETASTRDEG